MIVYVRLFQCYFYISLHDIEFIDRVFKKLGQNSKTVCNSVLTRMHSSFTKLLSQVDKYTYHGISSACVYGGGSRSEQIQMIKSGVDIVVATPGRLNDLIESKLLILDECSYLILDEADRMLDMGFEPQIKKVRYSFYIYIKWGRGFNLFLSKVS